MRFESQATPKKKGSSYKFSNFGFSTILLTFVMMCIVTFGVLSLITANADKKLSEKVAEKSNGYYEAEEIAYGYLTQLDIVLGEIQQTSTSETYYEDVMAQINSNPIGNSVFAERYITFTIPVTATQDLLVKVYVTDLDNVGTDGYYSLVEWKTVHNENTDIIDDGNMNLIGTDGN